MRQQSGEPEKPQVYFLNNPKNPIDTNYAGSSSDTNSRYYLPEPSQQNFRQRNVPQYENYLTPPARGFEPRILMTYNNNFGGPILTPLGGASSTAKRHAQSIDSESASSIPVAVRKPQMQVSLPHEEMNPTVPDHMVTPMRFSEKLGFVKLTPMLESKENESVPATEMPMEIDSEIEMGGKTTAVNQEMSAETTAVNKEISAETAAVNQGMSAETTAPSEIEVTEEVTEKDIDNNTSSGNNSSTEEEMMLFLSSEEDDSKTESKSNEDPTAGYNYYRYVVDYEPKEQKAVHKSEPQFVFHPRFQQTPFYREVHQFPNSFNSRSGQPVAEGVNQKDGFQIIPAKYISYSLSVSPRDESPDY